MRRLTIFGLVVFLMAAVLGAQTFTSLVALTGRNGTTANAPMIQGPDGNLYGTTSGGGLPVNVAKGTVFRMTPGGTLTTLYSFTGLDDGSAPKSSLVLGSDGNFYGTTSQDGFLNGTGGGQGTAFRILPSGVLTTLYRFGTVYPNDGAIPSTLVPGEDGNFYGVTYYGGVHNNGTLFRLGMDGTFKSIYQFGTSALDEGAPSAPLVKGSDGNFYGISYYGGLYAGGTLFKITPAGSITRVYDFGNGQFDGKLPVSLLLANDGNFYGSTSQGGSNSCGTVFKMASSGIVTFIHNFNCVDGNGIGPVIQGRDGNLYGVAGGGANENGTVYQMTAAGKLTSLYSFCAQASCADGTNPLTVMQASDGNLYGTTGLTDNGASGTIFRIQLAAPQAYTCTNATTPSISSIDSAGSYGGYSFFSSGTWLEIRGNNLADANDPRLVSGSSPGQWTSTDFNGLNAPTSLDGVSVSVNGKPAYVWFLSPTQLNVQAPEDTTTGLVNITVTNCKATSTPFPFQRKAIAPGMLAPSNYSSGGKQYLVATFSSDGAYVLNSSVAANFGLNGRPAKSGDVIVLYGIGFGDVTPSILPGTIAQQSNSLVTPVSVAFNGTNALVSYQGLAGGFVGLYEFYVTVPQGLTSGDYQITVSQGGSPLAQTFYLTLQTPTPPTTVQSVTISSTSLTSGSTTTGTVTLSAAAPAGGATVNLSSSSSAATVPATVVVAGGATSATFTITAGTVTSNQSVTITATYQGSSAQASLTVTAGSQLPPNYTFHINGNFGPGTELIAQINPGNQGGYVLGVLPQGGGFQLVWPGATASGLTVIFTGFMPTSSFVQVGTSQVQASTASMTLTLSPQGLVTSGNVSGTVSFTSSILSGTYSITGTYIGN